MSSQRIFGLVLLSVGAVVFLLGLHASDAVVVTAKEGVSGSYADKSMWYLVGGTAMALVGIALSLFGGSNRLPSK
jgi:uncharacterized membrane protein